MSSSEFLKHVDHYNDKASAPCQYIQIFHELLSCETEEQAIFKLKRMGISESSYNFKLERFKKIFELQEKEHEFLSTIYSKYVAYFNLNKSKPQKNLDVYVTILTDILNSGYSMYEYCSKYGRFTIRDIKMMHKHIYKDYPKIYNEFSEKCMNLSIDFYYNILEVVEHIICSDTFDVFDYYYSTRLAPLDFLEICKKILGEYTLKKVNHVIRKINEVSKIHTNLQAEIIGKTVIKGYELSQEEKFKIAEFLAKNYMPDNSYKYGLRKYVNGDERLVEYVNQPQKVMK